MCGGSHQLPCSLALAVCHVRLHPDDGHLGMWAHRRLAAPAQCQVLPRLSRPAQLLLRQGNANTPRVCARLVLGLRLDARLLSSQALSIVALVLHAIIAYVETFLMANFPGWIIGVLITKNVLCIVGEITALVGACMLERAQTNATQAAYAAQRLSMGQPQQQAIPLQVVVQPFGGAAGGGDRA